MILRFRKTTAVIVLILIFVALLSAVNYYIKQQQRLIGSDSDEYGCLVAAGYTWNETIGACVRKWLNNSDEYYKQKFYCSNEEKAAEVCNEIYMPVCSIPSMKTFSNSCFACIDKKTEYYIQGEC